MQSNIKQRLDLLQTVIRVSDAVANRAWVLVDLVVVAALVGLVAEEVDGGVLDAIRLLGVGLEVAQTVGLIPAGGEDIERDLAANGVAVSQLAIDCIRRWVEGYLTSSQYRKTSRAGHSQTSHGSCAPDHTSGIHFSPPCSHYDQWG